MKPKYNKKDDFIENPVDGSPLLRPAMPIAGIILFILIMLLYRNCKDNKPSNKSINNKQTFKYVDIKTNDTLKYYGYENLDTAMHYAKKEKKDLLLIFSCWACMNESGKEWKMLSLFGDNDKIQDNFIIAWLPIDDKKQLKDTLRFPLARFPITTIGSYNHYRQLELTETSSQPTFCFLDTSGQVFGQKIGYTNNKKEVEDFIYSGIIVH